MRRTARVLALASALAACTSACTSNKACEAYDPPVFCDRTVAKSVVLDASFSADERAAIERAMASWGDASSGHVRLTSASVSSSVTEHEALVRAVVPEGFVHVVRVENARDAALVEETNRLAGVGGSLRVKGFTDAGRTLLMVDEISGLTALRQIATHELGHQLGLAHSASPGDIMHGISGDVAECLREDPHPTQGDALQLLGALCGDSG